MGFTDAHKTKQELEREFDRLYDEHEQKVFSLAWRLTGDEEAAKDIRQKTFLTLHKNLIKVLGHPAPEGWLIQTAHYFIKTYKREQAYRAMHEMPIELAEQVPAPLSDDEVKDFQERLPSWITAKERRILILYYCYGYSQREISTIVGLTYNAVRARITRLHIKLREHGFDELDGFN